MNTRNEYINTNIIAVVLAYYIFYPNMIKINIDNDARIYRNLRVFSP